MKSFRLLLPVLGILAVIAVVLFLSKNSGTIKSSEKEFALDKPEETDHIIIRYDTAEISLVKTDASWQLNKMYMAKKEAVELLLSSLQRLEAIAPVPKNYQSIAAKKLENTGIHLEAYSKGRISRSFYIDYDTSEVAGTIILNEHSKVPFLVRLKGYPARNITGVFPTEIRYWRDNMLFGLTPEDIASVAVNYFNGEKTSFKIIYNNISLPKVIDPDKNIEINEPDIKNAGDYRYFFSNIKYMHLPPDTSIIINDKLIFAEITVEKTTNGNMTVSLYRKNRDAGDHGKINFDLNYCYAIINNEKEPVVLRYFDIDPILSDLGDFIKK
ncbi:MAG: hypothetical protein JXB00_03955 [Bacteroidales bacterium]|nr:hypothetical protein [Bacteroidales bacterium]